MLIRFHIDYNFLEYFYQKQSNTCKTKTNKVNVKVEKIIYIKLLNSPELQRGNKPPENSIKMCELTPTQVSVDQHDYRQKIFNLTLVNGVKFLT